MSTIGLALIAKNEEKRLPQLLASIEGAFDQIVLVDTGSTDGTVNVFRRWARKQKGLDFRIEHFEWVKDFAAARRYAHSFITTEWECWADCDDVITGAQNLRRVVAQAPDPVAAYVFGYNYGQHPDTRECVCYLKRERLVRRGKSQWVNRVHEAQVIDGFVQEVEPAIAEWVHCKQWSEVSEDVDFHRNIDILDAWVQDEPENTRVLVYLGTENMARGNHEDAMAWFHKYLGLNPEWDEERAQVHRKLALCYLNAGRYDEAQECAFSALKIMPNWTDSYLTLAESCYAMGQYEKCIQWCDEVIRRGKPETMLIINPLDYSFNPLKLKAGSLAVLDRVDEAIAAARDALALNPQDEPLNILSMQLRANAKREHTAKNIAMMVQQLVAHDEQAKALKLVEECVPWFADDHPGVVSIRSQLREHLEWVPNPETLLEHYAVGGSKPEDFLPEDKCDEVAAALPRTQFLYRGIHEQLVERHQHGLMDAAMAQVDQAMAVIGGSDADPA